MVDFSDPLVWIVGGIAIAIATFIMIFFKVFAGETRPAPRIERAYKLLSFLQNLQ